MISNRYNSNCNKRKTEHIELLLTYYICIFAFSYNNTVPHKRMGQGFGEFISYTLIESNVNGLVYDSTIGCVKAKYPNRFIV